jgi:hypothetical protein
MRRLVCAAAVLLVAACQTASPPPSSDAPVTVGDWTVETSGNVRVEGGYVN